MRLNGKKIALTEPVALVDLLVQNGFVLERIAVECNGRIIPKKEYAVQLIQEQDILEVVRFVGGG